MIPKSYSNARGQCYLWIHYLTVIPLLENISSCRISFPQSDCFLTKSYNSSCFRTKTFLRITFSNNTLQKGIDCVIRTIHSKVYGSKHCKNIHCSSTILRQNPVFSLPFTKCRNRRSKLFLNKASLKSVKSHTKPALHHYYQMSPQQKTRSLQISQFQFFFRKNKNKSTV